MAEIIRISIKGESGYGPLDEAYRDKVTLDRDSIRYEYKPMIESEENVSHKWSYRTISPLFRKLFRDAAAAVEVILSREGFPFVTDIGVTTFTVTYDDKTMVSRDYFLPSDEFKDCFDVIKQMVPGCECLPAVLMTSEDYNRED